MRLDDGRVVPNFICQALKGDPLTVYGDGLQTRSFCYVDDLVDGLYKLLISTENDPINLGNPREITIHQLASAVNSLTENPADIKFFPKQRAPADPQRRQPDITRAKKVLGWEPKVDLEPGLMKTIDDFKSRL
jgi:dTDP-glucose 4,6-dehydratase